MESDRLLWPKNEVFSVPDKRYSVVDKLHKRTGRWRKGPVRVQDHARVRLPLARPPVLALAQVHVQQVQPWEVVAEAEVEVAKKGESVITQDIVLKVITGGGGASTSGSGS